MSKLSARCLAALKALPIVEIASKYTHLKPQGPRFVGLSPFTKEKTPSFTVTPSTGRYMCFSTKKGGDTIDLVVNCEGLSFVEAAEALAHRFNVSLEYEGGEQPAVRSNKTEIYQIHDLAASFFREQFKASPVAQTYWTQDRAFRPETAEEFEIGFAPTDDANELGRRVLAGKFSPQAIRECGLFFSPRGLIQKAEDLKLRFSGRLMIPIHDAQGRCCAFAGRQIPNVEDRTNAAQAKYINSPETPIFSKGRIVFNLHRARAALRDAGEKERFNMVEGQLDVIRLWESGFRLAVGSQGTATTVEHLEQISRYPNGVRCLMDGDAAGQKAALRLIPLCLQSETDMVFTPMPDKQDPDSLLRGISPEEAAARMRVICARTFSPAAFAVDHLMPKPHQRDGLTAQGKARIVKEIINLLGHSPSAVAVWFNLEEAAKLLRIEQLAIWHEFLRTHQIPDVVPPQPQRPITGDAMQA